MINPSQPAKSFSSVWAYWICALLLCASTINYMDRQTLANCASHIKAEFKLDNQQYGQLESIFSIAFAAGALLFGLIADRVQIRWFYPAVLLGWSAMGALTGFANAFYELCLCRFLLGLFESGHWPCGLITTRRILPPESRALGNSLLQSGTAIGACITPLIIRYMMPPEAPPGRWRLVFQIIGAIGLVWVFGWLLSVKGDDVRSAPPAPDAAPAKKTNLWDDYADILRDRRLWVLVLVVLAINCCWHLFRAWMNLFLEEGRGYSKESALQIVFWYNLFTDVGCLSAGFATKWLIGRKWNPFTSQTLVFTVCCSLSMCTLVIPFLPRGWLFVIVLMLVGMGSLGQFPCYYTYSQQLSEKHTGSVVGALATLAWLFNALIQPLFGYWVDMQQKVDRAHAYDLPLAISGALPMLSCLALWYAWPRTADPDQPSTATATA